MWDDEAKMQELVSLDMDLPPIPRWQWECIQWPAAADMLIKKYGGTKKEQKKWKDIFKENNDE